MPIPSRRRARRAARILPAIVVAAAALLAPSIHAEVSGPSGREGVPFQGGAPTVNPALGIATVALPIEVPPGRHGLQPAIALGYSSGAGTGNAGFGFQLDIGSIQRSTRDGPPRFDNGDVFVLSLGGESFELAPLDAESTRFRTVIDSGFLIERVAPGPFGPGSTYWVARGRDGRAYRFGFHNDPEAGNVSQVADFKWGLDRVEDASGNVMEIRWAATAMGLYPLRIDYASHPATGLPPSNSVTFCWEERGDQAPTLWGERLVYRLALISTRASGRAARSWAFDYDTVAGTTMIGSCTAGAPPLPGDTDPGNSSNPTSSSGRGSDHGPRYMKPGSRQTASGLTAAGVEVGGTLPNARSALIRVRRGDGEGNILPPLEYGYDLDRDIGWPQVSGDLPPLPFLVATPDGDEDSGVRLQDINRDGLPDLLQLYGRVGATTSYDITHAVYLNTGNGFRYDQPWSDSLLNLIDPADVSRSAFFTIKRDTRRHLDNGVRFLDINDDGYVDVVRMAGYFTSGARREVFLNTGAGFTGDVAASFVLPPEVFVNLRSDSSEDYSDDPGVRIADVNGDGRADLLASRAEWNGPTDGKVYLYDRDGYRLDRGYVLPDEPFVRRISGGLWLDMGVRLMELDGDGYVDLFKAANVNGTVQNVAYLHTRRPGGPGPTWERSTEDWFLSQQGEAFVDVLSQGSGVSVDRGLRVADIDGDRRTDIVLARVWNGNPAEKFLYCPRVGGGWDGRVFSEFPDLFVTKAAGGIVRDQGVRLADLDGDGGLDVAVSAASGARTWSRNRAWQGKYLLSRFSNGIGGMTELTYAPAPHTGPIEGGAPAALPFPLAVVAERDEDDGMGHRLVTTYAYDGGYYQHRARELRGFRSVRVIEPGGAQASTTLFLQQPDLPAAPLLGSPQERTVSRVSDGALFSRTTWTYDTSDGLIPLAHPLLRSETAFYDWSTTDPAATPARRTAVSYQYVFDTATHPPDRLPRRRVERQEGDVDDPTDDRIVTEEFVSVLDPGAAAGPSSGRWLLDLPWHRWLTGADGGVVSESWTSYDDNPLGTLGARGLPTREEIRGGPQGAAGAVAPGDPENPVIRRGYDAYGNLEREVDALGHMRLFGHGGDDPTFTFPVSETDPLGRVTAHRYDPRTGQQILLIDPNGAVVHLEHDGFGRPVAEYGPYDSADRPTTSYRHDYDARPARVFRYAREVSGLGEKAGTDGCIESIAFFDGLGRLIETKVEAADGTMTVRGAVTFDAAGRVAAEALPFVSAGPEFAPAAQAPHARRYERDAAGRVLTVTEPSGAAWRRVYDGRTVGAIDPLGHRRDRVEDAFGQIVEVRDHHGVEASWSVAATARYAYDAAGRPTRVVDPSGATAHITYDAAGRRVVLDDPHVGSWRDSYDLQGRLIAETDPLGRVTRLQYDDLDRLVRKTLPEGAVHEWRYDEGGAAADAIGRLTSIADPTGSQAFTYDRLGRIVRTWRDLQGTAYLLDAAYDALGRVTTLTFPNGARVDYRYDRGGNLAAALPYADGFTYDERGHLTGLVLGNGERVARTYDEMTGRLLSIGAFAERPEVADVRLNYQYDADGLITAIEDASDPLAVLTDRFNYDDRHRLVRAAGPWGDLGYAYDDLGNLLLKGETGFFYDDPAHPLQATRTSAGMAIAYDSAGNVVSLQSAATTRRLEYDGAGRMVRLTDPSRDLTVTEEFDATRHRVREVVETSTTRSVRDTPMPQFEVRDGKITLQILAGDLRIATVGPDGSVLYPIADHLGSVRAVLDAQRHVVARYRYRPFGTVLPQQSGEPPVSHLFADAERCPETGFLLMGTRFYDPELGRFLQPDALVPDHYDPLAMHRYAYARDNPVNLSDPDGFFPWTPLVVAGVIALLDRDTRADAASSVALTAAVILLTGVAGPGAHAGIAALRASTPALYAAAATSVLLHTPLGEAIVEGNAMVFQELGLSPRGAGIAARVFSSFLLNSSLQRGFARGLAAKGAAQTGDPLGDRGGAADYLEGRDTSLEGLQTPTGDAYGTPPAGRIKHGRCVDLDQFYELRDDAGDVIGIYGTRELKLGFHHGSPGFFAGSGADLQTIASHHHYGYLIGGISTQQFARELFGQGYDATLFTLTGRASDFLIEFIYGPYGGGLALGVRAGHLHDGP
jgi:RHS repeat-associated protein